MRVGIDSYSYHRLYGEIRPDEDGPSQHWPIGPEPVLRHAAAINVDTLYLETCYLPAPEALDTEALSAGGPMELGFSWGHPWPAGRSHGLDAGRSPGAEDELRRWIDAAARLGHRVIRITAGSHHTRGDEPAAALIGRLAGPMRRSADHAAECGLSLALENHADLRAQEILDLLALVDRPNLGVCLDNINLLRVGDTMLEGTRLLAPHALLVQLKDAVLEDGVPFWGPVSTALGEGTAPLRELLPILVGSGFEGPVCVELASLGPGPVDELAMIERSVGWLRTNLPAASRTERQTGRAS